MWSDNETEIDAINIQHVVGAVVEILRTPHLSPVTVGVFGQWGIGKSSVIQMVRAALAPEKGKEHESATMVVYFNGWRFEGYEDAKSALMSTILEEIAKHRKLSAKAKRLLKRLRTSVDLMGLLKGGAEVAAHVKLAAITGGLSSPFSMIEGVRRAARARAETATVEDATKVAETAFSDEKRKKRDDVDVARLAHRSIRDFEKRFASLLGETNIERLVVVIDDLDRCLPPHVIDTLEAIRLFLAVKRTAFVIAADETLVRHAVRDRFPGMEALRAQVGEDYLEKMIQIPVRLPLLGRADLENYLNLLFAQRRLQPPRFSSLCSGLLVGAAAGANAGGGAKVGVQVPFSLDTAKDLLGADYTSELNSDLALAKQIVPVVALSVGGNPRQVKRYLNALMLRLSMARNRHVEIDAKLAAKLMLLEYFRSETSFMQLARWQAAQRGRPRELVQLERARAENAAVASPTASDRDTEALDNVSRVGPVARSSAAREAASSADNAGTPTPSAPGAKRGGASSGRAAETTVAQEEAPRLGEEATAWLSDDWLVAWLDTEPRLADVDLGPYFYFARDRFVTRGVSTQALGPVGEVVLTGLQASAESARRAVRDRALGLGHTEAFAVLSALAERARLSGKPDTDGESPYAGIYDLVGWRLELGHEAVRFFAAQTVGALRARTPMLLLAATSGGSAATQARALVERWETQSDNPGLAAASKLALRTPEKSAGPRAGA